MRAGSFTPPTTNGAAPPFPDSRGEKRRSSGELGDCEGPQIQRLHAIDEALLQSFAQDGCSELVSVADYAMLLAHRRGHACGPSSLEGWRAESVGFEGMGNVAAAGFPDVDLRVELRGLVVGNLPSTMLHNRDDPWRNAIPSAGSPWRPTPWVLQRHQTRRNLPSVGWWVLMGQPGPHWKNIVQIKERAP